MARICECPKCGKDITDTYEDFDPDVGIMSAGWYCEVCEIAVTDEWDDDEVFVNLSPSAQDHDVPQSGTGKCPRCNVLGEMGYGLAGGGIGPYMYCPSCGTVLSKSQDTGL